MSEHTWKKSMYNTWMCLDHKVMKRRDYKCDQRDMKAKQTFCWSEKKEGAGLDSRRRFAASLQEQKETGCRSTSLKCFENLSPTEPL